MNIMLRAPMALAALVLTGAVSAATVASDNFNTYAAGSALLGANGGSGWTGGWTASNNMMVAATAAGDSPMSGNALSVAPRTPEGIASRNLATAVNAGAVLIEFVFQFDAGAPDQNDFLGLWFGNSNAANIGLKVNCGDGSCPAGGTTADLFVRTSGTDNNTNAAYTTNITIGQSYTLMGLLEKVGTSTVYNRYSLWVDPTAAERSSLSGADAVAFGSSTLSSFSTVGFRSVNLTGNDRLLVDSLSIATVPEPGSLALVSAALLGLGAAARRKRQA